MNRVLIVDDHPLVSEAIGAAISTVGPFNISSALSAGEMWRLLESASRENDEYKIIFLDIHLPDANGVDLVPKIVAQYHVATILVSGQDDEFSVNTCMQRGASGFVKKSAKLSEFASAVKAVQAGGQYFPAPWTRSSKAMQGSVIAELSDKQRQVLDLVVKGKSNRQIGDELSLAEGTVKNKVSELLRVFDLQSRAQILVATAQIGYRPSRT